MNEPTPSIVELNRGVEHAFSALDFPVNEAADFFPRVASDFMVVSDICVRYAAALRVAPSTLFERLKPHLSGHLSKALTFHEGYLRYLCAAPIAAPALPSLAGKKVGIVIGQPAESRFHFSKVVANALLQTHLTLQCGVTVHLSTPSAQGWREVELVGPCDVSQYFQEVIHCRPGREPVHFSLTSGAEIVTYWLSPWEIQPKGMEALRQQHAGRCDVNIATVSAALEGVLSEPLPEVSKLGHLIHLVEIGLAAEFDPEVPELEASSNLCWLGHSATSRAQRATSIAPALALEFLLEWFEWSRYRACRFGEVGELLQLLRRGLEELHAALNSPERDKTVDIFPSLVPKLSSIIGALGAP